MQSTCQVIVISWLLSLFSGEERKIQAHLSLFSVSIIVHVTPVQPLMILSSFSLFSLFHLDGKRMTFILSLSKQNSDFCFIGFVCVLQFRGGKVYWNLQCYNNAPLKKTAPSLGIASLGKHQHCSCKLFDKSTSFSSVFYCSFLSLTLKIICFTTYEANLFFHSITCPPSQVFSPLGICRAGVNLCLPTPQSIVMFTGRDPENKFPLESSSYWTSDGQGQGSEGSAWRSQVLSSLPAPPFFPPGSQRQPLKCGRDF